MKSFDIREILGLGLKSARYPDLDEQSLAYLKGVKLAKPLKLYAGDQEKGDVFDGSSYYEYFASKGQVDGKLADPISGRVVHFTSPESFAEAQRLLEELREEELEKQLHDKIIANQMIMLASAGSPAQTESQYKSMTEGLKAFALKVGTIAGLDPDKIVVTNPNPSNKASFYNALLASVDALIKNFDDEKRDAVVDAVKSNTSFMSLAELMLYASRFPGLDAVVKSRMALIKKSGLGVAAAQMKTGNELSEIVDDKHRKTLVTNLVERSSAVDFGKAILGFEQPKDIRNKLDWYPTIDLA